MARFYVDNDVSLRLAAVLDSRGHDVVTTRALGRQTAGDHEQLWLAATMRRVLLTHNLRDYLLLHGAWRLWFPALMHAGPVSVRIWRVRGRAWLAHTPVHAGIVVLPQRQPVDFLAEHLHALLAQSGALTNRLYRLHQATWQVHD